MSAMNKRAKGPKTSRGIISRRDFLRGAGVVAGSAILAGCTTPAEESAPIAAPTAVPTVAGPKYGGKLTWSFDQDPANLVPFGAINTSNPD